MASGEMQERSGEKWIEMTRGTVWFGVVKHTQAMSLFFCVSFVVVVLFSLRHRHSTHASSSSF